MTDWIAEAKSVYEDFKADGFEITVRVAGSEGVWSDTTMSYTGATADTDHTTYGIKDNYYIREINGTIIQQNDTKLIFSAYDLPELTTINEILIDSVVQNVVTIKKIDPGNTAVMYEAQLRI